MPNNAAHCKFCGDPIASSDPFFCSNMCARNFGYAAVRKGLGTEIYWKTIARLPDFKEPLPPRVRLQEQEQNKDGEQQP